MIDGPYGVSHPAYRQATAVSFLASSTVSVVSEPAVRTRHVSKMPQRGVKRVNHRSHQTLSEVSWYNLPVR
ncbi:hypothetical protein A8144_13380 [Mycobacterium leprae 3125609]|nr:hypothetical protein A8144_13380 [Mycobacterium leprae 3125609]OAX70187.1 hypothetical protein A3216_13385 [Mycobacterium leprae 7935681]